MSHLNMQQCKEAVGKIVRLAERHGAMVLEKDIPLTTVKLQRGPMICLVQAGRDHTGFCRTRWFVDPTLPEAVIKQFEDTADRKIFGIGQRRQAVSTSVLMKNLEEQFAWFQASEVPAAA